MTGKENLRRYLLAMFSDVGVVELRALGQETWTGYFDNVRDFCSAVRWADRCGRFTGVYATLNARSAPGSTNSLNPGRRSGGTTDRDVERYRRLAFDFDPVREAGVSSTSEELALAMERADFLAELLRGKGWPEPLVAMSGNGYHLQYRVDFENRAPIADSLSHLYRGLALRMDTPEVSFDVKVRNPSRIFRVYGTSARKGVATDDRPHRRSWCATPDDWQTVPSEMVEALAREMESLCTARQTPVTTGKPLTAKPQGKGDYKTLDIAAWFRSSGLYKRALSGSKHAVICPWGSEHSTVDNIRDSSTVIFEGNGGWPTFHCSHSHCEGRGVVEVMALLGDADSFCAKEYSRD